MTKRRTIGDNPLDSITMPSRRNTKPAKPATAAAQQAAPERAALPTIIPATSTYAREAQAPSPFHNGYALFHRGRIRVVGGDVPPGETMLTPPRHGEARGFHLADDGFIAIQRDVISLTVQSAEAIRRTRNLFLWAMLGAFLIGPLGALAGSLYGGRAHPVLLIELHLHDGRNILAAASARTVRDIEAELH